MEENLRFNVVFDDRYGTYPLSKIRGVVVVYPCEEKRLEIPNSVWSVRLDILDRPFTSSETFREEFFKEIYSGCIEKGLTTTTKMEDLKIAAQCVYKLLQKKRYELGF